MLILKVFGWIFAAPFVIMYMFVCAIFGIRLPEPESEDYKRGYEKGFEDGYDEGFDDGDW